MISLDFLYKGLTEEQIRKNQELLMGFLNFLYEGLAPEHIRKHHAQQDSIQAKLPSNIYSGGKELIQKDVTGPEIHDYTQYIIDKAVIYTTLSEAERLKVRSSLFYYSVFAHCGAALGLGVAGCSYAQNMMPVAALAGVVFAAFEVRAFQAGIEYREWKNKVTEICRTRHYCSKHFLALKERDLRGSYFHVQEVQSIFHQLQYQLVSDCNEAIRSGDPEKITTAFHEFFAKNPMQKEYWDYAYPNKKIMILNSNHPEFESIVFKFQFLKQKAKNLQLKQPDEFILRSIESKENQSNMLKSQITFFSGTFSSEEECTLADHHPHASSLS